MCTLEWYFKRLGRLPEYEIVLSLLQDAEHLGCTYLSKEIKFHSIESFYHR